jgi:hypothetical protein
MCYLGIIEFIIGISGLLLLNFISKSIIIIALKKIYYLCFFIIIVLWTYYVFIITIEKNKKIASYIRNHIGEIRILLIILIIIFGIIDYILPLNYVFDQYGKVRYLTGGIIPILKVISSFLIVLPLYTIINNRREILFRKLLPYFVTFILLIIVLIIHELAPDASLLCFFITILYYFIYYRLENPDIILVREFKKNSEEMKFIKEEYPFIFNMPLELRLILNEIAVSKENNLVNKKIKIDKKKLDNLVNKFIKSSCDEQYDSYTYTDAEKNDDYLDDMLITKEIYSLKELQDVLKEDNLPKW